MKRVVIDKKGWMNTTLPEDFKIPDFVKDHEKYIEREKMGLYINTHPYRFYTYETSDNQQDTVDCKSSKQFAEKRMKGRGAKEEDIANVLDRIHQFRHLIGMMSVNTKKAFGGTGYNRGVLEHRGDELLDLFGRLHSVDEVYQIVVQDWGYNLDKTTVQSFYSRNLQEIERLRSQYEADYSDLALTKKRGRLDRLSVMFHTYYKKWSDEGHRLPYSQEMRAILRQIKEEVEGDIVNINIQGQINVDLTMEANKTMSEVFRRIPINNMIVAMVAAKKGINPTNILSQLTNSFYSAFNGFGVYDPTKEVQHPVDLTYNWNEISRRHKFGDLKEVQEAVIVKELVEPEESAKMVNAKQKLLDILEKDKKENGKRKSGK
jgi:hypothetical protein